MRRTPQQQRSSALVKCILEAAAQVEATVGRPRASTNKIAARAGVSIGSLYQYFGSKEAIFEALDAQAHSKSPSGTSLERPTQRLDFCYAG